MAPKSKAPPPPPPPMAMMVVVLRAALLLPSTTAPPTMATPRTLSWVRVTYVRGVWQTRGPDICRWCREGSWRQGGASGDLGMSMCRCGAARRSVNWRAESVCEPQSAAKSHGRAGGMAAGGSIERDGSRIDLVCGAKSACVFSRAGDGRYTDISEYAVSSHSNASGDPSRSSTPSLLGRVGRPSGG